MTRELNLIYPDPGDKTRLIEFGKQAIDDRGQRGEGKPETFDFLGFTHFRGIHATFYYHHYFFY